MYENTKQEEEAEKERGNIQQNEQEGDESNGSDKNDSDDEDMEDDMEADDATVSVVCIYLTSSNTFLRHLTEGNITVGHRTFTDQLECMTDHCWPWLDTMTVQFFLCWVSTHWYVQ